MNMFSGDRQPARSEVREMVKCKNCKDKILISDAVEWEGKGGRTVYTCRDARCTETMER